MNTIIVSQKAFHDFIEKLEKADYEAHSATADGRQIIRFVKQGTVSTDYSASCIYDVGVPGCYYTITFKLI